MELSPMSNGHIRLLDEESSMDGTPPATILFLGEPIDQMGDFIDTGQVDGKEFDMDIADHIF
jgi:hypothetical protein